MWWSWILLYRQVRDDQRRMEEVPRRSRLRRRQVLARRKVVPKDQVPYWNDARNHGGGTPGKRQLSRAGRELGLRQGAIATGSATKPARNTACRRKLNGKKPRAAPISAAIHGETTSTIPTPIIVGASRSIPDRSVGFYDGMKRGDFETHDGKSPYGAYDMAGNVMEWCQDWYSRDYYSISPRKNPKGPATGAYRVLRGGTFFNEAFDLRTYARSAGWPSFKGHRMVGFRAVREP